MQTGRLLLRFFTMQDFQHLSNLLNEDAVLEMMEYEAFSKEKIISKLALYKRWQEQYGFSVFAIFEKDRGAFIGSCGIALFDNPDGKRNILPKLDLQKYDGMDLELVYSLHQKYWGNGYATEAAQVVIGFIKNNFKDVSRIVASTIDNIASQNVLQKVGFEFVSEIDTEEYGKEKLFKLSLEG